MPARRVRQSKASALRHDGRISVRENDDSTRRRRKICPQKGAGMIASDHPGLKRTSCSPSMCTQRAHDSEPLAVGTLGVRLKACSKRKPTSPVKQLTPGAPVSLSHAASRFNREDISGSSAFETLATKPKL